MKDIVILIVDDDPTICEYLKRLLESLGCRIEAAHTLATGLDMMSNLRPRPSFVFLDLNFPDARAEQTVKSIPRFHEINAKASIVIITGLVDEKIEQMSNTLGAAFRQKPDLRSQKDVWEAIEEAIQIGKQHGQEAYEVTSKVIEKIAQLRQPLVNEKNEGRAS